MEDDYHTYVMQLRVYLFLMLVYLIFFRVFLPASKLSTYPLYNKKALEPFMLFTTEPSSLSKVDKNY